MCHKYKAFSSPSKHLARELKRIVDTIPRCNHFVLNIQLKGRIEPTYN